MDSIFTPSKAQHFKKIIDKYMEDEFKKAGISRLDGIYLGCLKDNNGISLVELTNIVHFDKANTTRVINGLEEKGFVAKKVDEKDSRKYKIFLTEKANTLNEYIVGCKSKIHEIAFKGITKQEKESFCKTLNKIIENLTNIN